MFYSVGTTIEKKIDKQTRKGYWDEKETMKMGLKTEKIKKGHYSEEKI